jgi:hypothetical protein
VPELNENIFAGCCEKGKRTVRSSNGRVTKKYTANVRTINQQTLPGLLLPSLLLPDAANLIPSGPDLRGVARKNLSPAVPLLGLFCIFPKLPPEKSMRFCIISVYEPIE